jgi:hypothetical protein
VNREELDDYKDISAQAAQILMEDGWTQGTFIDTKTGAHCALGAVRAALGWGGLPGQDQPLELLQALQIFANITSAYGIAICSLSTAPEEKKMDSFTICSIVTYNDTDDREVTEVVGFLQDFSNGRFDSLFDVGPPYYDVGPTPSEETQL